MKRETASYREGILADALHVVAVVLQIDDIGVGIDHVCPIESLESAEGPQTHALVQAGRTKDH